MLGTSRPSTSAMSMYVRLDQGTRGHGLMPCHSNTNLFIQKFNDEKTVRYSRSPKIINHVTAKDRQFCIKADCTTRREFAHGSANIRVPASAATRNSSGSKGTFSLISSSHHLQAHFLCKASRDCDTVNAPIASLTFIYSTTSSGKTPPCPFLVTQTE